MHVFVDVEPVGFNRGFYTVDLRFFYRVTADAFVGAVRPVEVCGLCVFDKRVILYGGEGGSMVFSSDDQCFGMGDQQAFRGNVPTAVVEAVDPICLNVKLLDVCDCRPFDSELFEIPAFICSCFDCDLFFQNSGKRVFVSLGQFSIVRLERDTQLVMPVYDYCMPEKECASSTEDDPCEIFRHITFPVDEFFPPSGVSPVTPCRPC